MGGDGLITSVIIKPWEPSPPVLCVVKVRIPQHRHMVDYIFLSHYYRIVQLSYVTILLKNLLTISNLTLVMLLI